MLAEHEVGTGDVRESDEEHIGAGSTREPGRLGVKEEHVLPLARRVALEAEVRDQERIARSPADDLEAEIVECDAPLAHLEGAAVGRRDRRATEIERRDRRLAWVSRAVALDDLRDPCAQI